MVESLLGEEGIWLIRCTQRIMELEPARTRLEAIQIAIMLRQDCEAAHPVTAAEQWHATRET